MEAIQNKSKKKLLTIKCYVCKNTQFQGDMTYFYCCEPQKFQKLVCVNCLQKINCNNCSLKKANNKIKYDDLKTKYLEERKKPVKKLQNILHKNEYHSLSKDQEKQKQKICIICQRNSVKLPARFYTHEDCQSFYCYPCLYMLYNSQNEMFVKNDYTIKKSYILILPCCQQNHSNIIKFEEMFCRQRCVFCGCKSKQRVNQMINVQNKLSFCLICYFYEIQKQQLAVEIQSVQKLVIYIIQNYPDQCYLCDQKIALFYPMEPLMIKAMNSNLCINCDHQNIDPKSEDKINKIDFIAKHFKALIMTPQTLVEAKRYFCHQCKQCIDASEIQNKNLIPFKNKYKCIAILFNIFEWKDSKNYCNICLYFKYKTIRQKYNKKQQKKSVSERQMSRFTFQQLLYQSHFKKHCMVCGMNSKQITIKNLQTYQHRLDNNLYNKHINFKFLLCQFCAYNMKENPMKYKRLMDIKEQIYKPRQYQSSLNKLRNQKYNKDYSLQINKADKQKNLQVNHRILGTNSFIQFEQFKSLQKQKQVKKQQKQKVWYDPISMDEISLYKSLQKQHKNKVVEKVVQQQKSQKIIQQSSNKVIQQKLINQVSQQKLIQQLNNKVNQIKIEQKSQKQKCEVKKQGINLTEQKPIQIPKQKEKRKRVYSFFNLTDFNQNHIRNSLTTSSNQIKSQQKDNQKLQNQENYVINQETDTNNLQRINEMK